MKWILYSILILNVGFASWHFRGFNADADLPRSVAELHMENQLVLLHELDSEAGAGAEKFKAAKLCYSLGPFTQLAELSAAQKVIEEQGVNLKRIKLRDTSLSGYWVILPTSKTRKDASKIITRLKKLKINDYFIVATGPYENAISLGVFSQKNLARRRVDEMIRLGFVPSLLNVALPRKVHWLNWYKASVKQPDEELLTNLKSLYSRLSKVERTCS